MKYEYVTPEKLWTNYSELPIEAKILLTENQYHKQLMFSYGYIPEESRK